MNELIKINPDGKTTARELYDFLNLHPAAYSRWCKSNIEDNDFADEGLDYFPFNMNVEHGGQASTNYYLSVPFAKKLCMLSKSERGEQARNYFIEVERRYQTSSQLPTMTQAQLIAGIAQIQVEQEQKLIELEGRLDGVKSTFANREEESWRAWACQSIDKIVDRSGFLDHQSAWREAYGMLESRARCVLDIRKQNIRRRLAETGVSKTKLNSIGKIDAIEQDARLKEIFTSILKEMLIRYVA